MRMLRVLAAVLVAGAGASRPTADGRAASRTGNWSCWESPRTPAFRNWAANRNCVVRSGREAETRARLEPRPRESRAGRVYCSTRRRIWCRSSALSTAESRRRRSSSRTRTSGTTRAHVSRPRVDRREGRSGVRHRSDGRVPAGNGPWSLLVSRSNIEVRVLTPDSRSTLERRHPRDGVRRAAPR